MKNGQCPECNSSNVFKHVNGVRFGDGGGGDGVTIFSGDLNHLIRYVHYESYVCVGCGYFKNYVVDKAPLQEVQQKWNKAA